MGIYSGELIYGRAFMRISERWFGEVYIWRGLILVIVQYHEYSILSDNAYAVWGKVGDKMFMHEIINMTEKGI